MNDETYKKYYNYILYFYDKKEKFFLTMVHQEIAKMLPKKFSKIRDEMKKIDIIYNAIGDFLFLEYEKIESREIGKWIFQEIKKYFENYYEPLKNEEIKEMACDFWEVWRTDNEKINPAEIEGYNEFLEKHKNTL